MKKLTSLAELATEFRVNKSKLNYWAKQGRIKPVAIVGGMQVFDSLETVKTVKKLLAK